MARSVRIEFEGAFYHAMARGNRREAIFLDYIHLNPVRAGLVRVRNKESVLDYEWSSLSSGYALSRRKRPCWLAAEDGLALFGFADSVAGRRKMVERLDRRAVEEEMEGC